MMMKKRVSILLIGVMISVCQIYAGQRMSVIVEKANVRSGPGDRYDVLWMVEKYHPVLIVKENDGWYKFKDFEGDEGWISQNLLSDVDSVIVRKDNCNVRSGPGTNYKVAFTVDKGIPFKVLKKEGSWYKVQHSDGDTGWIVKALVW